MKKPALFALALSLLVPSVVDAGDLDSARRLDAISREVISAQLDQVSEEAAPPSQGALLKDRLRRVGHGFWSLLIPGWSQYRSGHNTRAIAFASAEAVIWGSYAFSWFQGDYREDQYRDFAQTFAGIENTGRDDDDYWRAVGAYQYSEAYNDAIRRENRAARDEQELNGETPTIGIDDGVVGGDAAWTWTSERRRREYVQRRSDAISAYDRAEFILLFAVLNRVVAVADAIRSGAPSDGDDADSASLIEAGGFSVGVDFQPDPIDPGATLRLGRSF